MSWADTLSDRSRSALIAVLTAAAMLIVAGVSLALYDSEIYKAQKVKEVTVQAQILAASVAAPLDFQDSQVTHEYLNAFQVNPEIDAAAVYDNKGRPAAAFTRDASRPAPIGAPPEKAVFEDEFLTVVTQVRQDDRLVGSVYVRAVTEPLLRRMARYGGILLLVTMASLMVAVLLAAHAALSRANTQLQSRAAELAESNSQLLVEMGEREKAENALRQAQKMEAVGQLTGGIAHDFNNMLAVVVGNLDLLLRRAARGETDLSKYAKGALEGAKRGAKLTAQLLAFSRQQPLAPVLLDANRLVSGMSELLRSALGEHIRFETVIAGGLWPIHADKTQLETVILNLAVNARDAMPEGGTLTVETANARLATPPASDPQAAPPGDYVMIAISDTGTGMTQDVLAKAFDPFFTTKPVGRGTGLGLSQVYGFVKQSHGHVRIYSEVGKGTTVKLYLPRSAAPEQHEAAAGGPSVTPGGHPREVILVVEDEESVRGVTVDALRDLGYTVYEADGMSTALTMLEQHPDIRLLFTDIVMPDGNGRKLATEAQAARPGLKVLYTTGYTRDAIVHNGVLEAGVALITKPYAIEQLAAKIRDVLNG